MPSILYYLRQNYTYQYREFNHKSLGVKSNRDCILHAIENVLFFSLCIWYLVFGILYISCICVCCLFRFLSNAYAQNGELIYFFHYVCMYNTCIRVCLCVSVFVISFYFYFLFKRHQKIETHYGCFSFTHSACCRQRSYSQCSTRPSPPSQPLSIYHFGNCIRLKKFIYFYFFLAFFCWPKKKTIKLSMKKFRYPSQFD